MCHPAQLPPEMLLKDCQVTRTRGSGPGGQHRNKVETAIVVEHLPSGLRGEASERRSQDQNRRQAIHRLRIKLAIGERRSSGDEPSGVWRQRIKAGRISVGSPIARALIGKEEGDSVEVAAPGGARSYEVLSVRYV